MQSELNHNIRHLPLPQSVREAITAARKQAGTFYAFTEADTQLLIQSQDGTASGKSYNVFAQYIESVIQQSTLAIVIAIWCLSHP